MHLSSLLEIVADALPDRVAVAACDDGDLTYAGALREGPGGVAPPPG